MVRCLSVRVEEVHVECDLVSFAKCAVHCFRQLQGMAWQMRLKQVVNAALKRVVDCSACGMGGDFSKCLGYKDYCARGGCRDAAADFLFFTQKEVCNVVVVAQSCSADRDAVGT